MKKQLFWMIGAALALTSCSNDEQVAVNPANEITFRTTVPMRTLASNIYNGTNIQLQTTGFYVDAWMVEKGSETEGVHHIQNEKYSFKSDAYYIDATYQEAGVNKEPHYWSVDDESIWGEAWASGYNDIKKVTSDKKTSYKYVVTVDKEIADQKDFITAPVYYKKANDSDVPDAIPLTFKHQLAKIGIKAKNDSEYDIAIKKVVLGNIQVAGENPTLEVTLDESENVGKEKAQEGNLGWTGLESGKYEVNFTSAKILNKKSETVPEMSILNETADGEDGANQQFFMLYPQEIKAWGEGTDAEKVIDGSEGNAASGAYIALLAKIQHNIEGEDPFTVYPTGEDIDKTEGEDQYGWVCVAVPTLTWNANKQYNYELTFKDNAIGYRKDGTPIVGTKQLSFTVTKVGWDEGEGVTSQPAMSGE